MAALQSKLDVVMIVVLEQSTEKYADLLALAESQTVSTIWCGNKDADDIKTTETFPGVMAIVKKPQHTIHKFDYTSPIVVLDTVSDPGNVGTILRTAHWFGIYNVVLTDNSVDLYNPKVVRSSMGSIFNMTVAESDDIIADVEHFKEKNYQVIALDMQGTSVKETSLPNNGVYIFGSESHGLRKKLLEAADLRISIPGSNNTDSLNVAISAGIILSQL